ncbi:hypothetical protein MM239_11525 [Belliella sp. DSM 111904]|uniref:Outer membrane protein beta-barrel domain-containing protein n=1 Tax=Belliella filtrata TaxID=2923435 RepID=A0ABS9V0T8_9BACT|nr:hypothetical protein [Belliella filtrata]MCH7410026.1 hypothetical protein [Belliella filtrata]
MKKIFILVFFMPILSFGQFSKGEKFVGGNMSYYSSKIKYAPSNNPSTTLFSLNSQFGFFVSQSLAVGPAVNFVSSSQPNLNPATNLFQTSKISGLAGGLFIRKFFTISDSFFFSLEGKGLAGRVNRDLSSPFLYEEHSTRVHLSFYPAFTFMPNQKWGFDATIGEASYQSNWYTNPSEESNFQVNFGQVKIGVNYFFGRNGD